MIRVPTLKKATAIACMALILSACAGSKDKKLKSNVQAPGIDFAKATPEESEAELRGLVEALVQSAPSDEDPDAARFLKRAPYYFKEYTVYPEGTKGYTLDMHEKESKTAPYAAEVTLAALRYSTRLEKSREVARNDSNFYRATGVKTLSFELRNGKWRRRGSFYETEEKEEFVEGKWVLASEVRPSAVSHEPEQGWFGRTWDRVRFWR